MFFQLVRAGMELYTEVDRHQWNPVGLEGDLLLFFRDFKQSIDAQNVYSLSKLIADDYYSESFVNQNKQQLLDHYQDFFSKVPFFARLALEFLICKTPELKDQQVYFVVKPTLKVHTLGITWLSGPFGTDDRMLMVLKQDESSGLFRIVNTERV